MPEHLISQKQIDPYYYELLIDTKDPEIVAGLKEPIKAEFRKHGYKTLVLEEEKQDQLLVSLIALVIKDGGMKVVSTSTQAQDALSFATRKQAELNPSEVSFASPADSKPD